MIANTLERSGSVFKKRVFRRNTSEPSVVNAKLQKIVLSAPLRPFRGPGHNNLHELLDLGTKISIAKRWLSSYYFSAFETKLVSNPARLSSLIQKRRRDAIFVTEKSQVGVSFRGQLWR